MKELDLPPYAPSLIESMRSIGYSFDSAISDIIDNSIAAKASKVSIQFRPFQNPYIAIIDDGIGMSPKELVTGMRHGHKNPLEKRASGDLGRYGLGLKTASLSQCRKLTVVTMKDGVLSGCRWDIDFIIEKEKWTLLILDKKEIAKIPHVDELIKKGTGTIVLWEELDKLALVEISLEDGLGKKMDHAREHLALIFHRFLNSEEGLPALKISINNLEVKAIDPFLRKHKATQVLDEDSFTVEKQKISVKPFILPHISKLNSSDAELAGGKDGLRSQQGFYIYRNGRLIIWGTWFKIAGKDELSKLARVKVDIPNSLDHLWTLDIKKSVAHPPEIVRKNLKRIIEKIRDASGRTLIYRGRSTSKSELVLGWKEISDRDGFRYEINLEHPYLNLIKSKISEGEFQLLKSFLKILEATLPVDSIYSRIASDQKNLAAINPPDIKDMLEIYLKGLEKQEAQIMLEGLMNIEPFNKFKDILPKLMKELR